MITIRSEELQLQLTINFFNVKAPYVGAFPYSFNETCVLRDYLYSVTVFVIALEILLVIDCEMSVASII